MIVRKLDLINFRNFNQLGVKFEEGINIILGNNAVGKTNLLEAIYYALKARSFKNIKDTMLITKGKEESYIKSIVDSDRLENQIEITLTKKAKTILLNEERIKKISDLRDLFHVVVFVPDDMKILKESKSLRRHLLDEIISDVDIVYLETLRAYYKILEQRNNLLKKHQHRSYFKEQLQALDIEFSKKAAVIINKRYFYTHKLNHTVQSISSHLSNHDEKVELLYHSIISPGELNEVGSSFYDQLKQSRKKDLQYTYTTFGCHRDDLEVLIGKNNSKYYASQGQIRTAILSIKLAHLDLLRYYKEETPIILLDDVFSELDHRRTTYLLEIIRGMQSFLTTTDIDKMNQFKERNIIYLEDEVKEIR